MSDPVVHEAESNPTALTTVPARVRAPSNLWKWALAIAAVAAAGALATVRLADLKRDQQGVQRQLEELTAQHVRDLAELRNFEERVAATARRTDPNIIQNVRKYFRQEPRFVRASNLQNHPRLRQQRLNIILRKNSTYA